MRGYKPSYVVDFAEECAPTSPRGLVVWFGDELKNAKRGHRQLLREAHKIAEMVASGFNLYSPLTSSEHAMLYAAKEIVNIARMPANANPLRALNIKVLITYLQYDQLLEQGIEQHLTVTSR